MTNTMIMALCATVFTCSVISIDETTTVHEDDLIQEFISDGHLTAGQEDLYKYDIDNFGPPKGLTALEDALEPPSENAAQQVQSTSHPRAQPVAAVAADQPMPGQRHSSAYYAKAAVKPAVRPSKSHENGHQELQADSVMKAKKMEAQKKMEAHKKMEEAVMEAKKVEAQKKREAHKKMVAEIMAAKKIEAQTKVEAQEKMVAEKKADMMEVKRMETKRVEAKKEETEEEAKRKEAKRMEAKEEEAEEEAKRKVVEDVARETKMKEAKKRK